MIDAKDYVLAGDAIFTIRSHKTDTHFTYRVRKGRDHPMGNVFFVNVLTGPDNINNYTYMGMIDAQRPGIDPYFLRTRNSKLSNDTLSFKAFVWFFQNLMRTGKTPEQCDFIPSTRCCRCGRPLTHPESATDGIGPECKKRRLTR